MDKNLIAILNGTGGTSNVPSAGDTSSDKLIAALTDRLTRQGQGISSSSSSQIQDAITGAMSDIKESGALTDKRLQSERMREVSFARDRAGATYTAALEGRTGYATQVAGLRELTDTTEKSVRDLDKRYQEAIMANDANTASQLSQLRMQKLEFQTQQEQNLFQNMMSVANMQQSSIDSMMRSNEFWAGQEQQERQFVVGMAQSSYQFQKNLGIQYKELGLKEQELDISRQRNAISQAEFNLRKDEINKEKNTTFVKAAVRDRIQKMKDQNIDVGSMDILSFVTQFGGELGQTLPGFKMDADVLAQIVSEAKDDVMKDGGGTVSQPTGRTGGVLPSLASGFNKLYGFGEGGLMGSFTNFWLGSKQ